MKHIDPSFWVGLVFGSIIYAVAEDTRTALAVMTFTLAGGLFHIGRRLDQLHEKVLAADGKL